MLRAPRESCGSLGDRRQDAEKELNERRKELESLDCLVRDHDQTLADQGESLRNAKVAMEQSQQELEEMRRAFALANADLSRAESNKQLLSRRLGRPDSVST